MDFGQVSWNRLYMHWTELWMNKKMNLSLTHQTVSIWDGNIDVTLVIVNNNSISTKYTRLSRSVQNYIKSETCNASCYHLFSKQNSFSTLIACNSDSLYAVEWLVRSNPNVHLDQLGWWIQLNHSPAINMRSLFMWKIHLNNITTVYN